MALRGLTIPEPERAQRYLRHVGYYRFSPYLIPFRSRSQSEQLRPGTTFDDVLDLYVFDRKLRGPSQMSVGSVFRHGRWPPAASRARRR
ncbi:Abi family protein [Kocuria atrinae]|uniref:Abi family protein n=1 Tax=Kocuria atrinae TaxID=592377 RepID=UPI001CB9D4FD|nr:Abi family protein [Kocuria atrinae]